MEIETFFVANYMAPDANMHVARKELLRRWPERAHDHDYFEVFLIERGSTDHWINGRRERLVPGHMTFIRPADRHAFRADAVTGCRIINVMFRIETAAHFLVRYPEEFCGRFFDSPEPYPETHFLEGPRMERAVHVAQELTKARLSLARVEEFLLTLANRVVEPITTVNSNVPRWLAQACDAARDPLVFKDGARGFIRAAGRSHEHVCRTCRDVLGLTPSAYINNVRAEYAADLLARSSLPISEIASECGIDNVGHFYRLFRNHYGTTPRAYRLHHQKSPFEATA